MSRQTPNLLPANHTVVELAVSHTPLLLLPPSRVDFAFASIVQNSPECMQGMATHDLQYVNGFMTHMQKLKAIPVRPAVVAPIPTAEERESYERLSLAEIATLMSGDTAA